MGKRIAELNKKKPETALSVTDALEFLKAHTNVKFDETVEVNIPTTLNGQKSDQQLRTAVNLPNGTGKKVTLVVFAKGDKAKEAEKAGADYIADEELIAKIQKGWLEFDKVIATPDMMKDVSKLAKILGPKGLMPNPKAGTVATDVATAIQNQKAGQVEIKVDKQNCINLSIGKISFETKKLEENFNAVFEAIMRNKPTGAKGVYLKRLVVSTTMGLGIELDRSKLSM